MRLALLDRDGVLNVDLAHSVRHPGELEMIPGAAAAVARLNGAGIPVAVVSNQSVVGRGIVSPEMLERINDRVRTALAREGGRIDAWFVCPDPPDRPTERRKPRPGMLREALARFRTAPADAVMVGDALTDLEAAAAAGCRRVLVRTGKGAATQARGLPAHLLPVAVHDDLAAAVAALLGRP
ncbi:D-glycero-alpha-D-manno-heptose-1,7-bisphosphate 7-phosphatase [Stella sp.]|uniref:D-glycero-alpha-D-manno-heptose-1,7-bisphosphate 7-phosphatase n=1 Tax=Stella sp. TaxID=2912054 RepID=UPI0035B347AD